jgi:MerR family transcriptional regulator, light-induced transcriptional regulator
MEQVHHTIHMAARKSGLTPHVIRVWERRYRAVEPARSGTNRRLYSEDEIERLGLLRQAVEAGYRISNIARLPVGDLERLLMTAPEREVEERRQGSRAEDAATDFVGRCVGAIRRMDAHAFEDALTRSLIAYGHQGLLRKVIAPLTQAIGELWQQGELSAAHEHFGSAFLRSFLGNAARPFAMNDGTPAVVVATPAGQLHELGAVMIASAARNMGWRVIYLGVSLPSAEIAGAVLQNKARAVALSMVYPTDDPQLPRELADLRRFLPSEVRILAGGRAAQAYRDALNQIGAFQSEDLDAFCGQLDDIRHQAEAPA